jgi:hypothetical protein
MLGIVFLSMYKACSKRRILHVPNAFEIMDNLDFPKSAVRGSWKRRTFVTRMRAKFAGAFLLR